MRILMVMMLTVCSFQLVAQDLKLIKTGTLQFNLAQTKYEDLKWVIFSDRNDPVSRMRDRSANAPRDYVYPPEQPGKQIWFPVIDLQPRPGFKMTAAFEHVQQGDSVCFNGNFWEICGELKEELGYDEHLEYWENQLFVTSEAAVLKEITFELPMDDDQILNLNPLAERWSGRVAVYGKQNSEWKQVAMQEVTMGGTGEPMLSKETSPLSRDLVLDRLSSAADYLVNSQNLNPRSPTYGGLYLFYDMESDTYRRSDWIWSYGPSIQVLIEASKIRELSPELSSETLMTAARQIAEASLRFQQDDEKHPAYGLVMCRYDPRTDTPHGAEGYFSPADSWFLAGWGWMPYFKATGDERFLHATAKMAIGIDHILGPDTILPNGKHPIVEQDYLMKAEKWKNWTMDESGFGMKGAEELYAVTQDPYHRYVGNKYITGLLDHLERPDGLWDRTWHRNDPDYADNGWPVGAPKGTPVLIETKYSTRGLGWAMIGLLATHGMMPEGDIYLNKAIKLADHLVKSQAGDGHWDFLFDGAYEGEVSEKGTALWSLLFYQLYGYTGNEKHLEVARKALVWCINNQYTAPEDSPAYGGIVGNNRESGVVYRRWSPLICSYTIGWYGLALLEELKLQNAN